MSRNKQTFVKHRNYISIFPTFFQFLVSCSRPTKLHLYKILVLLNQICLTFQNKGESDFHDIPNLRMRFTQNSKKRHTCITFEH